MMADRPCILIAEDDRSLAETMRDVFEEDFSVETAADGQEALSMARRVHPDVMVLDARMPRVDGLRACRALREDPATANVPILMVTGEDPATAPSRASAARLGVAGHTEAPARPARREGAGRADAPRRRAERVPRVARGPGHRERADHHGHRRGPGHGRPAGLRRGRDRLPGEAVQHLPA